MSKFFSRLSTARVSAAIVAIAIACGAALRIDHLGAAELTGDEAISWLAASAPSLGAMERIHVQMNRGKLALHELLLHGWIAVFGQSEAALRSLSVVFGVASIALVYFATRELMLMDDAEGEADRGTDARMVAALTTLIFALSLLMIRFAREARMYALALALVLPQVIFFLRACRRGGYANLAGIVVFTALSIAANFTTALVFASEAVWLALISARPDTASTTRRRAISNAAAIGAGFIILAPFWAHAALLAQGIRRGMLGWVAMPGRFEPIETFESASGTWVFAILAPLAIYGAVRASRSHRTAVEFALIWMWLPPVALLLGSYAIFPMLVTRYVIESFVPFYALAAVGIVALRRPLVQTVATVAVAWLMLARVHNYRGKPRTAQYREAIAAALRDGGRDKGLATLEWAGESATVTYYLPAEYRRSLFVIPYYLPQRADVAPPIVILPVGAPHMILARMFEEYPVLLERFRFVEVRRR